MKTRFTSIECKSLSGRAIVVVDGVLYLDRVEI